MLSKTSERIYYLKKQILTEPDKGIKADLKKLLKELEKGKPKL